MLMKFRDLKGKQKRKLITWFLCYIIIGLAILAYFSISLNSERTHARESWDAYFLEQPDDPELVEKLSQTATKVTCGTYVENLREVNLKSSYYRVEFRVWFRWEGDEDLDMANNFRIYKGLINKQTLLKETRENGVNYQLVSMDVSVSKNFNVKRFPLESEQMRFYVESEYPVSRVLFVPDRENSGINEHLTITGYKFMRHDIGDIIMTYASTHGDPQLTDRMITSEIITMFEINRSGFGLYFKCFIALAGTVTWALIALFICSHHHVDPLGMLPGALFGTVGNIMIGANLLPDALDMGLLEYVNLWGILTILAVTIAIININYIRNKQQDNAFAHLYGTVMFDVMLFLAVSGQIVLPLMAYIL